MFFLLFIRYCYTLTSSVLFYRVVIPTAALECASAEATTKELVTEVGEQEKLLRAVEVMMAGQRPTDEVQRRVLPTALLFYPSFAFFSGYFVFVLVVSLCVIIT